MFNLHLYAYNTFGICDDNIFRPQYRYSFDIFKISSLSDQSIEILSKWFVHNLWILCSKTASERGANLRLAPLEPQGTSWKLWPPCYCKRENVDARATLAIEDDIITRLSIYSLCTPRSIQLPKQQCINTLKTSGIIETRWARQPLTVLTSVPQWTTLLAKLRILLFFTYSVLIKYRR